MKSGLARQVQAEGLVLGLFGKLTVELQAIGVPDSSM
jgi:hypothetical protein